MSIHVALNHVTSYKYDRAINLGPQVIRLRPAPHSRTRILSYSLRVLPEPHFINWQQDPESNYLARLVFPEKTTEFKIEVDLVAEMSVINPFDFFLEPYAEEFPFEYAKDLQNELLPYRQKLPLSPLFEKFLKSIPREKVGSANFLVALNQKLADHIGYTIRMEPGVQTPEDGLEGIGLLTEGHRAHVADLERQERQRGHTGQHEDSYPGIQRFTLHIEPFFYPFIHIIAPRPGACPSTAALN